MPFAGSRLLLAVALLLHGVTSSPVYDPIHDSSQRPLDVLPQKGSFITPVHPEKSKRKLNGKFLHMTDFHPDEFYRVHSSTQEGFACHRGKGPAGTYGAETTDCDSPMALVNATLDWIRVNLKDEIDFVVWTGDTARHDSDEKHPRSTSHVLGTNIAVAKKVVETFSDDDGQLSIPIVPNFGNNDFLPHNIFYPGPNKWLQYYTSIWHRFIPEEQRHSFGFGGWFEVEVIPNKLSVFSLNTMYFFDRNAGVDGCAGPSEPGFKHLEWLSVQLQRLRERGMKAILIGHVPPARTENKQLWDETCWQKYTLWLKQFRDVVTASLYGHMNIDHFLLQDTEDIDIALNTENAPLRTSLEEEFSIESKSDYLLELRNYWSALPGSAIKALEEDDDSEQLDDVDHDDADALRKKGKGGKNKNGKKHKKRKGLDKIGGKYGERYQLTLVSPSVVPNYYPTIRLIEYNITGLEDNPVWSDPMATQEVDFSDILKSISEEEEEPRQELKRDLEAERRKTNKKGKGHKGKKKHKKPKNPKDPHLVIPQDPHKKSLPGPAYFPQPLTLTGYTQYFANLTWINNDMTDEDVDGKRWRDGDFSDQDPGHNKPKPRKFRYEVEYSTFTDKIFKLPDLTVRSYLRLAYRIGKRHDAKKGKGRGKGKNKDKNKGKGKSMEEVDEDFELDLEDSQEFDELETSQGDVEISHDTVLEQEPEPVSESVQSEDDIEQDSESEEQESEEEPDDDTEADATTKGKKRKGKKGGKRKKTNKVWRHFLKEAFVSTIPDKQLKKLARR